MPTVKNSGVQLETINKDEEKKRILREYKLLLQLLKDKLDGNEEAKRKLHEAFKLAADAHSVMRRESGEPYILHPIEVAKICVKEIGLGVRSAISALLHDVVEDTIVTIEDIQKRFGKEISGIVEGLTKIDIVVSTNESVSKQAENFKRILLSIVDDPRIIFIKLADRLHNMRTLSGSSREKQLKISSETMYIYAPLAYRLGFNRIKQEMEDLCLRYSSPEEFKKIEDSIAESRMQRTRFIAHFVKPIREELDKEGSISYHISGRTKSIYSIWNKMAKKSVSFDEIYDFFAIRIIIKGFKTSKEEIEACWKVYSIVSNMYRPIPGRIRDWLSAPKSNGYRALHLTVLTNKGRAVEVQIRSEKMDNIAEQGMAAHWKYKEGKSDDNLFDEWIKRIRQNLNSQSMDSNSVDFLIDFKNDFLSDEIYVFTHKGDIKVLPSGASILDFAYSVHSDIGNHCFAAKTNDKLVSINHRLESGDRVEIITSSKQTPKPDWLNSVITSKARSKIREALNVEKREKAKEGKILFERKCKLWDISPSQTLIAYLQQQLKLSSPLDLYYFAIQEDNIDRIKKIIDEKDKSVPKETPKLAATKATNAHKGEVEIFGKTDEKIMYTLAKCCDPVPGDEIFGFISQNAAEGVRIHKTNCHNASYLFANYAYRIVPAKWTVGLKRLFETTLQIEGVDSQGLINEITNEISSHLQLNIISMNIEAKDRNFTGTIRISVLDKEQIDKVILFFTNHPSISKVSRKDNLEIK